MAGEGSRELARGGAVRAARVLVVLPFAVPGRRSGRTAVDRAGRVAIITGLVLAGAGPLRSARPRGAGGAARGAALRTTGAYRLTRNPIYVGLLIAASGWVVWFARVDLIVVWVLLAVVLVAKARVEERRLVTRFGDDYREYAAHTPLMLWRRGIR
nr:methyltransferase [Agromyces flavus]